ncbi:hypothetical protein LPJ55_005239 [Coemansia sp. RSA 990]|nr:hypothetical protein LPJ55_005239 [Coemansia sp. RSA 990]KAJ2649263.1 hypothetical protein IWW40_003251 [Coemansia sp. RSA 1250]
MVHRSRSVLPVWYAESRFLHSSAIREIADTTDSFVFGRMFQTPTNSRYRDGNHVLLTFCHLEYPWDCNGVLADPPANLANIVATTYQPAIPRCIIDCTLKEPTATSSIVQQFQSQGFSVQPAKDKVMRLLVTEGWKHRKPSSSIRLARTGDLEQLAECAASSFNYSEQEWVGDKLRRQMESPLFTIYVVEEILAFVVLFEWAERAKDLAWVQVIGTRPEYRRRGLATDLLTHSISRLSVGTRVYLEAEEQNTFYEKLGFEHVGTIDSVECLANT